MIKERAKFIRFRSSLFWDVDPKIIDPRKHATYIIERVMEFGNDKGVKWMWERYPLKSMRRVVKNSRGLSKMSANFWAIMLNIPRKEVFCLRKSSKVPRTFNPISSMWDLRTIGRIKR